MLRTNLIRDELAASGFHLDTATPNPFDRRWIMPHPTNTELVLTGFIPDGEKERSALTLFTNQQHLPVDWHTNPLNIVVGCSTINDLTLLSSLIDATVERFRNLPA